MKVEVEGREERIPVDKVRVLWYFHLENLTSDLGAVGHRGQAYTWKHLKNEEQPTDARGRSECTGQAVTLRIFQGKDVGSSGENAGWPGVELKGLGSQGSLEGQWDPSIECSYDVSCQKLGTSGKHVSSWLEEALRVLRELQVRSQQGELSKEPQKHSEENRSQLYVSAESREH